MTLATFKHGGNWDWIARMFGIEGPTFERLSTRFIDKIWDNLYDLFVEKWTGELTMNKISTRIEN